MSVFCIVVSDTDLSVGAVVPVFIFFNALIMECGGAGVSGVSS